MKILGLSFAHDDGACILDGCSDFGAIRKFHDDRDAALRDLDRVAQWKKYIRTLWRLNGEADPRGTWPGWRPAGLDLDPIRHSWFETALRGYCEAVHERGIRLNLSTGDMNDWNGDQQRFWFRRVAEIARSVSPDLCWLWAIANEMRATWNGGESSENLDRAKELLEIAKAVNPRMLLAVSDPTECDSVNLSRLSRAPATVALLHDVRTPGANFIRRIFNDGAYEGRRDMTPPRPCAQDEPSGFNSRENGPFDRLVYQPLSRHSDLFAGATLAITTGQAFTHFGDSSLLNRRPLDENWGFAELPQLWKAMEIPNDIGQGRPCPGQDPAGPFEVSGSGFGRIDGQLKNNDTLWIGAASDATGQPRRLTLRWSATVKAYRPDPSSPVEWEKTGSAGETIWTGPAGNDGDDAPDPIVLRVDRR